MITKWYYSTEVGIHEQWFKKLNGWCTDEQYDDFMAEVLLDWEAAARCKIHQAMAIYLGARARV